MKVECSKFKYKKGENYGENITTNKRSRAKSTRKEHEKQNSVIQEEKE